MFAGNTDTKRNIRRYAPAFLVFDERIAAPPTISIKPVRYTRNNLKGNSGGTISKKYCGLVKCLIPIKTYIKLIM